MRVADIAQATSAISVFCGAPLSPVVARTRATSPNALIILADDMGWGDVSFMGSTNQQTPHIDSLGCLGARYSGALRGSVANDRTRGLRQRPNRAIEKWSGAW